MLSMALDSRPCPTVELSEACVVESVWCVLGVLWAGVVGRMAVELWGGWCGVRLVARTLGGCRMAYGSGAVGRVVWCGVGLGTATPTRCLGLEAFRHRIEQHLPLCLDCDGLCQGRTEDFFSVTFVLECSSGTIPTKIR